MICISQFHWSWTNSSAFFHYRYAVGFDILGLEKKADEEMYQAKERYCRESGKDRRHH